MSFEGISTIQDNSAKPKKHNLSICTAFKNEAVFMREWIEYHLLIGVDHFYLYNTGSTDLSIGVLSPYLKKNQVTLINWPNLSANENDELWVLGTQFTAYENAVKYQALNETKWLLFLDIDEFLVPPCKSIPEILQKYDDYPGVTLISEYFDASDLGSLPKRKLIIQSAELTLPPKPTPRKAVEKTIFKPELTTYFTWPPHQYVFSNGKKAIEVTRDKLRINQYLDRNKGFIPEKVKHKLNMGGQKLSYDEMKEWMNRGYEIEDPEKAIYRYVPELLEKLEQN